MKKILIRQYIEEKSCPIFVGCDSFEKMLHFIHEKTKIVVLTDSNVKKIYGMSLEKYFKHKKISALIIAFPAGEKNKTHKTKMLIEEKMQRAGVSRDAIIIAFGGGVVGDMAGFVAATYMRGIPFLQIPTSLMAMIDSSIGGKTGIDTKYGKNLIGAFWHPDAVLMDMQFLKSLPMKHKINGLVEAIKIFLVLDEKSFFYLERNRKKIFSDENRLIHVIKKAVALKAMVVTEDFYDKNLRMILNFGHTIGHAVEHACDYKLLHGYSVGVGMLIESHLALSIGLLDLLSFQRIVKLLSYFGINGELIRNISIKKTMNAISMDKKNSLEKTNFIFLKNIGSIYKKNSMVHTVSEKLIRESIQFIMRGTHVWK